MWKCTKCGRTAEAGFEICWACGERCVPGGASAIQTAPPFDSTVMRAEEVDLDVPAESRGLTIDQLIFVGLNGYAVALHRDTGKIIWSNNEMHSGFVTLLLDGDRLIVSTNGYLYCLDPLTGRIRWHNPMTGYGFGAPTALVSVRGQSSQTVLEQAAVSKQDPKHSWPPATA